MILVQSRENEFSYKLVIWKDVKLAPGRIKLKYFLRTEYLNLDPQVFHGLRNMMQQHEFTIKTLQNTREQTNASEYFW